ncbi:tripartite tricarboxylate transporter TctB family protein [Ancylobacter sp. MQZ15Z-1]|uniref:Tripartite tricarboxylate transporter TctB family protein n=1 Tax=Ancylobacter mangrovi TaxID=2972472 RepID=A0A9X2T3U1_9HYPH|nr:tripartite tricarboxylate transporter TctB family protein [Ancylobacter mangrovi]MCS0497705.1 tripartite tricarboxylate transporter TctB family protein [Ancylobacter mangrovi]
MLQRAFRRQDTWAGLMFLGVGIAALWIGRDYPTGTATSMGPGFFPDLLSFLLCGIGALVTLRGLIADGEKITGTALRPFLVLVAVALFALAVTSGGLVPAIVVLTVVGACAGHEFRLHEVAALTLALAVFSVAVFDWALGMHLPLWPAW